MVLLLLAAAQPACRVRTFAVEQICAGAPDCDDGLDCTEDLCEWDGRCLNAPDHARCPAAKLCEPGTGCVQGGACDADADCDDGWFCNGFEVCAATCGAGSEPACDDGVGCTEDRCDWFVDACTGAPRDGRCDDGVFCNGAERCDVASGCFLEPLSCDDGNPCSADSCDEAAGGCVATAMDEDGDGWTAAVAPSGEACNGQDCDDADPGLNPGNPEICDNGADDDCDGHLDCDDVLCWGVGACPGGGCTGTCAPSITLTQAGKAQYDSTAMAGASDDVTCWCGFPGYDGPEVVYRISVASPNKTLVVNLSELTADLDLFVMQPPSGGCDPASCIAWSVNLGTDPEILELPLTSADDLFVAVDGKGGAVGDYLLWWALICRIAPC